ncbi:MAG: MCE family protein [Melioribacteraceae bacterium]|nr:MAG: MCE family protein [Melioribacteraceae bacterium]
MLKHFEGARLGIFIFFGTVLLILAIFMIGNRDSLFVSSITVKTYFQKVQGLRTGAPVRLSGYDIGSVSSMSLVSDTSGRVEVIMRIEEDVKHFIRLDSEASIETEGLVGKQIISISPGTTKFAAVTDGGIIKAKDPVSVEAIIKEVQDIMSYIKDITKEFTGISTKINAGEGTIGKLINDDQLYYAAVDITKSADRNLTTITERLEDVSNFIISLGGGVEDVMNNVDTAIADLKFMISDIKQGKGTLGLLMKDESVYDSVKATINNLVGTTEATMIGARRFAENMEALKHNWLFKSYFEQRGYWETADYEKSIDEKILELRKQNEELQKRINELKDLEKQVESIKK